MEMLIVMVYLGARKTSTDSPAPTLTTFFNRIVKEVEGRSHFNVSTRWSREELVSLAEKPVPSTRCFYKSNEASKMRGF